METLSFAFGMLAMIALALVIVVVVGMVKVIKMQGTINDMGRWRNESNQELHLRIDNLNSYVDSRLDKIIGNSAKKQINK